MMIKKRFSIKNIPGWLVMLIGFGILYATGWHTEAIGQFQRILLATGIKNANMPERSEVLPTSDSGNGSSVGTASMTGAGFQMVDLQGNTVSFESLQGKVIFLNIWATWCPPCIAEMPNIQSLYKKVDTENIAFVMLSVDEGGEEKVKKFIDRKGFTFPVYMSKSPLPRAFQTSAIPTTFILNPEGAIVSKQEGMAEYDTKEVREFLESMIKN